MLMKSPLLLCRAGQFLDPLKLLRIVFMAALCGILFVPDTRAQTLPSGFVHERVTPQGGMPEPTSMAFLPDGRLLVNQQGGSVRVVLADGTLVSTPALTRSPNTDGERGMIGVAVDPNFTSNGRVYIFYNPTVSGSVKGRVSRFTMSGNTVSSASETVLIEYTDQHMFHNGGGLAFGPDGFLYCSTGEDTQGSPAQNLDDFRGKVLRITTDGNPAPGNPFTGGAARSRVWAFGLRNPFTLTPDLVGGRMFVNDVGDSSFEEVNNCTTGGRNFGWPNQD